jgi:hypothetical protein
LVLLAIKEAPTIIEWLRAKHTVTNPGQPVPTDAEIIAAYQNAFVSSLAQDSAWLAAHPRETP